MVEHIFSSLRFFLKVSLLTLGFFVVSITFTHAATFTITGTLYSDEGSTQITAGKTLKLAIGTSTVSVQSTTTDSGAGTFSFTVDNSNGLAVDDPFVIFVDGAAEDASTVSKFTSTTANVSNFDLYQDRVIIRQEGSTSTNLADLAFYDSSDDADIEYTAATTSNELSIIGGAELHIWSGDTFVNAASSTLSGSFHNDGGVFDHNDGTMTLTGASSTISGTTTGSSALGDIVIVGWYSMSDSASTSHLTINSGATLETPNSALTINGVYTNNGTSTNTSGTIYFDGAAFYDISEAEHQQHKYVGGYLLYAKFSATGDKMFALDYTGKQIMEHTLSTPWDISTVSYVDSFVVSGQDTAPQGFVFSATGDKMFLVGDTGNDINEYTLGTPWDVSTATFVDSFSVNTQETAPQDVAFSSSGDKMFVLGDSGNDVNEYTLGTPWDVSTATFVDSKSISGQAPIPNGLGFSPNGDKMFVTGYLYIFEYTLGTNFDVSTASYVDSFYAGNQGRYPGSVVFSATGDKMFISEADTDSVHEYTLRAHHSGTLTGSSALGNVVISGNKQVFDVQASTTDFTITSGGAFMTATSSTLEISGSYVNNGILDAKGGLIDFTGTSETIAGALTATSTFRDVAISGSYTISNNASTSDFTINSGGSLTAPSLLTVYGDYTNSGTMTNNSGTIYLGSKRYNVARAIQTKSLDVSAQDIYAHSFTFSATGDKMFMFGLDGDDVNEYTLSSPYDITTASFVDSYYVGGLVGSGDCLVFSSTGNKMFLCDWNASRITEYGLATPWDVSTAGSGFSHDMPNYPSGLAFDPSGNKMFYLTSGGVINEYTLYTAFDITTATLVDTLSGFPGSYGNVQDITFSATGDKLFLVSNSHYGIVYEYSLGVNYDISTASYVDTHTVLDVLGRSVDTETITFTPDGKKMFILDSIVDGVLEYDVTGSQTLSGNMVDTSAFNNLQLLGDSTITFEATASTTGSFSASNLGSTTVSFNAGDTYTFQNLDLVGGNKNEPISLVSSAFGSDWYLVVPGNATATKVYVQDSDACGSAGGGINATSSTDGGNNTCWSFAIGETISFSGTVYSDTGVTPITGGEIVKLVTTFYSATTTSDGSGNYTFSVQNDDVPIYGSIVLFIDENVSTRASLVTRATSSDSNITNLDIYKDYLVAKQIATTTPEIDIFAFDLYDSVDDGDLQYTASSSTGTLDLLGSHGLYVAASSTFVSAASTTIGGLFNNFGTFSDSGGTTTFNGSFQNDGTITLNEATPIFNDSFQNDGTFTNNDGTLHFGGTNKTISGTLTGDSTLGTVVIDGSYTMSNNASTSGLTISTNATLTAPTLLSIGGAYTNNGAFDSNSGEVVVSVDGQSAPDIGSALYTGVSTSTTDQTTTPYSAIFNDIGTKMYVVGTTEDAIYAYDLSTPYNIASAVYSGESTTTANVNNVPYAIFFKPDGTKLFLSGTQGGGKLHAYDLGTAWDISTAAYNGEWLNTNSQVSSPRTLTFNNDGTKVFVTGFFTANNSYLRAYDLSTAWDISSATYNSESKYIGGQAGNPRGIRFNPAGTRMYILDGDDVTLYAYSLSTPFDISTISYNGISYSALAQDTFVTGLTFDHLLSHFYITGYYAQEVFKYKIPTFPELSGNMVGDSAFNDLSIRAGSGVVFANGASSTGTFTVDDITLFVVFNEGDTYTFQNFNVTGADPTSEIELKSSSSTGDWYLIVPGNATTSFAYIQDSDACGSYGGGLEAVLSTNGGNNTCWTFGDGATTTIAGVLYSDEGLSPITSGKIIKLVVNNGLYIPIATSTSNGSGSYSFDVPEGYMFANSPILVFVDNDGSVYGTTITKASSSEPGISNLNIYQDTVIVRQEGDAAGVLLTDLATYDSSDDSDVQYTASSTADSLDILNGQKFYVWNGTSFTNAASSTFSGDFHNDGGTFGANGGNIKFTSTAGTISGSTTGSSGLGSVVIDGNYTMSDSASTSNLTVTENSNLSASSSLSTSDLILGTSSNLYASTTLSTSDLTIGSNATLIAPTTLTMSGHYSNSGSFVHNSGSVYATGVSDISKFTFTHATSVDAYDTCNQGLGFSTNGDKMYVVDCAGADVSEYDLATAWDVSTASYVHSLNINDQDTDPYGIAFSVTGDKMFVTGGNGSDINEYSLSTAWDVSSATFVDSFSTVNQDNYPIGIDFNPTGDKMYVTGGGNSAPDGINQYSLSTAWDVSTASFVDVFVTETHNGWPVGLVLSADGDKMYVVDDSNDEIEEYSLSTPWDVSSASFVNDLSVSSEESCPTGLAASSDGDKFYVVGWCTNNVTQYDLGITNFSGNLVGTSAFNNLTFDKVTSFGFLSSASTTGTFTIANTVPSVTFNAGSRYTFENVDWAGVSTTSELTLKSSASGTEWYLDVPGTQLTVDYVNVQDSDAAEVSGGVTATDSTDSGNNTNWTFGAAEVGGSTGSTTISDHDSTQINNAFSFQNVTNEPFYAFKLIPESGNATITEVSITLTGAKKIATSDFSNWKLYKDHDNDALYDASDEQVGGAGVMTLSDGEGTLVFSTDFLSTTTTNYLVVADWNAPENGSALKADLLTSGLSATDSNGTQDIYGNVNHIQHHRNNSGGGGNAAALGGAAPPITGTTTGGTNEGGERIGNNPHFKWPTASAGDWTNPANIYDQVDGTYGTTSTDSASSTFSNHDFVINSGSTIEGIEVKLEISGTTAAGDISVQLSWDNGATWTTTKTTPTLTTTDTVVSLGGAADTWGRTWSVSDFSNANFQVRLIGNTSSNSVQVDAMQVQVYYQVSGGGSGGGGAL